MPMRRSSKWPQTARRLPEHLLCVLFRLSS